MHLENLLENTGASITLRIEEFQEAEIKHLQKVLKRLSRYGDRINVMVCEKLRDSIDIDSSVFNVVLVS
jgi:hypothetical protein